MTTNSNMSMKPLFWNSEEGRIPSFFKDFPYFGEISRRRRAIASQLHNREWGCDVSFWKDANEKHIAVDLGEIIRRHCGWPNSCFLPDDPCDLLLTGSVDGLQGTCALLEISKKYHINDDDIEMLASSSFGDIVKYVSQHKSDSSSL